MVSQPQGAKRRNRASHRECLLSTGARASNRKPPSTTSTLHPEDTLTLHFTYPHANYSDLINRLIPFIPERLAAWGGGLFCKHIITIEFEVEQLMIVCFYLYKSAPTAPQKYKICHKALLIIPGTSKASSWCSSVLC